MALKQRRMQRFIRNAFPLEHCTPERQKHVLLQAGPVGPMPEDNRNAMLEMARDFVKQAWQFRQLALTFDEKGVQPFDSIVQEFRATPQNRITAKHMLHLMTAYFGETVIAVTGGYWRTTPRLSVVELPNSEIVVPLLDVANRIARDEGTALTDRFRDICQLAESTTHASAESA